MLGHQVGVLGDNVVRSLVPFGPRVGPRVQGNQVVGPRVLEDNVVRPRGLGDMGELGNKVVSPCMLGRSVPSVDV